MADFSGKAWAAEDFEDRDSKERYGLSDPSPAERRYWDEQEHHARYDEGHAGTYTPASVLEQQDEDESAPPSAPRRAA